MNNLKKLLYNTDPSANAVNKEAFRVKLLSQTDGLTMPKIKSNKLRIVATVSCACILLICVIRTDLVQAAGAAIKYVKDIFYTKEVVVNKDDVTGDYIQFSKNHIEFNEEDIRNSKDFIIDDSLAGQIMRDEPLSLEEAQNVYGRSIPLPELFQNEEGDSSNKITYAIDNETILHVEFNRGNLILMVFDMFRDRHASYGLPNKKEVAKYTVGDINVYSFGNSDNNTSYAFTYNYFLYWIICVNPITDDELIGIIDTLNK